MKFIPMSDDQIRQLPEKAEQVFKLASSVFKEISSMKTRQIGNQAWLIQRLFNQLYNMGAMYEELIRYGVVRDDDDGLHYVVDARASFRTLENTFQLSQEDHLPLRWNILEPGHHDSRTAALSEVNHNLKKIMDMIQIFKNDIFDPDKGYRAREEKQKELYIFAKIMQTKFHQEYCKLKWLAHDYEQSAPQDSTHLLHPLETQYSKAQAEFIKPYELVPALKEFFRSTLGSSYLDPNESFKRFQESAQMPITNSYRTSATTVTDAQQLPSGPLQKMSGFFKELRQSILPNDPLKDRVSQRLEQDRRAAEQLQRFQGYFDLLVMSRFNWISFFLDQAARGTNPVHAMKRAFHTIKDLYVFIQNAQQEYFLITQLASFQHYMDRTQKRMMELLQYCEAIIASHIDKKEQADLLAIHQGLNILLQPSLMTRLQYTEIDLQSKLTTEDELQCFDQQVRNPLKDNILDLKTTLDLIGSTQDAVSRFFSTCKPDDLIKEILNKLSMINQAIQISQNYPKACAQRQNITWMIEQRQIIHHMLNTCQLIVNCLDEEKKQTQLWRDSRQVMHELLIWNIPMLANVSHHDVSCEQPRCRQGLS